MFLNMEAKVVLLLYICLHSSLHQQYLFMVNGASVATSSAQSASPKNGTNITITNYQTKNSSNVTKAQLQEVLNGTVNNGSVESKLSRKITKTENVPTPNGDQNITKANATDSNGKIETNATTKLTMVAPNVVIDANALKNNAMRDQLKVNAIIDDGLVKGSNQSNVHDGGSVNSTQPSIVANNPAVKATQTSRAKADLGKQLTNAGPTNSSVQETSTSTSTTTTKASTMTTVTTTPTTTTTTTTTTPKPKKPTITLGLGDFPHLPGEPIAIQKSTDSKMPVYNDNVAPPNAQPSQELNSGYNYYTSRDYIVPIMTVLFTIPLAIGVVITTYRRFRDCWSTRHYRRMDFLVDGMYND